MYLKTLSVSEVNEYIKKITDKDFILNNLTVKGEISNLKLHSSGHLYFSIKDENSKLSCVMFSSNVNMLDSIPYDGESVEVKGRIGIYLKEGSYQLYCISIKKAGAGLLYEKYNKLKAKLLDEGLFDDKFKKPIPYMAKNIGVITSPTSAAVRDVIRVSKRRNTNVNLIIYPSLVQGRGASDNICKGIEYFNNNNSVDVIIVCRGGGSIEELWAFNEENVARSIFDSKIPIVSGVGHETDFTIADFVSDYRASTPSAAAEVCVVNIEDINDKIEKYMSLIKKSLNKMIADEHSSLKLYKSILNYNSPLKTIVNDKKMINDAESMLKRNINDIIKEKRDKFHHCNNLLQAYNPYAVLGKGYSIITDEEGKTLYKVDDFKEDREVRLILSDGEINKKLIN